MADIHGRIRLSFSDDELTDAAETARQISSQHTAVMLDRKTSKKRSQNCRLSEEPIASSSIVAMYFVCQRLERMSKWLLVGQGPDELFCGYRRHLGCDTALTGEARQMGARSGGRGYHALHEMKTLKRGLYSLDVPERMKRYQNILSLLPGDNIDALFQDGLLGRDTGDRILECWRDLAPLMTETDELGGFQFVEVRSTLPDELLMYADKLSMAHGLEVRCPIWTGS